MKYILLQVVLVFASTGAFVGVVAGAGTDACGIYFTPDGVTNCATYSPGQVLSAYLVLHNPSADSGVGAWQCTIEADETIVVFNMLLSGQAISFTQYPDFLVGLGQPLPAADAVVLASFSIYATAPGGVRLGPLDGATYGTPMYADGGNLNELIPMIPEYGASGGYVLTVGLPECPRGSSDGSVLDTPATWGALKSDYY